MNHAFLLADKTVLTPRSEIDLEEQILGEIRLEAGYMRE